MTQYLVTGTDLRNAIKTALSEQDMDPQGDNYVIAYSLDIVNHVLRLLNRFKVAESEPTDNHTQESRREIDTSDYPVIRIGDVARNELVAMICEAYKNGLAD